MKAIPHWSNGLTIKAENDAEGLWLKQWLMETARENKHFLKFFQKHCHIRSGYAEYDTLEPVKDVYIDDLIAHPENSDVIFDLFLDPTEGL